MTLQSVDRYPLTPIQQGMLFHYLASGDPGVDIEQIIVTLDEALDLDAFREAWKKVVAGHAVFRTGFEWDGLDQPIQQVEERVELPFEVLDHPGQDEDTRRREFEAFLREDRRRGFDLSRAPLTRLSVQRTANGKSVAVWTFNHIILDGLSFPIVLKEVFQHYDASLANRAFEPLPPQPYRAHIEHLKKQDLSGENAKAFWKERLGKFTSPTPLPGAEATPRELPEGEDDQGEKAIRLSAASTSRLAELARQHGVTMNNFVQGAWAILLGRYAGEEDIVFGTIRSCRRSSVDGAERMVGNFINTVPLRLRIRPDQPAMGFFEDIRKDQSEVWRYEQTPLVDIQSWSDVPAGRPLFDTILVFDDFLLDTHLASQGGPWANRRFKLIERTSFPLTLYGNAEPELLLRIAYDRRRFNDGTIDRLLKYLRQILDEVSRNPEQVLGKLAMLSDDDRNTIVNVWNETAGAYPRHALIHQLIEKQVEKTPDAMALSFKDQELSYRELNARANRLARRLVSAGIGPDKIAGICLDRSIDMVVAILGVMKAGGAYLPLDPAFPKDRIAYMIEDSGAKVILTHPPTSIEIPGERDAGRPEIICLDRERADISKEDAANLNVDISSSHLAYMIYTSGSTGKPKGVMVEHRNVANFFTGMDSRIEHDPPGVWLAVTSISFDISVLELLYTLARGFKVVLYREPERRAPVTALPAAIASKTMSFGLFYFASDEGEYAGNKYTLLLEGAKFADRNGFIAVSIPERHFHAFGGLYPNPSVAAAAISSITQNIQIRAGSVVLPLHHPIRVAEEWSLVDNLSNGRVALSFASGWQPVDFVIRPDAYENRHKVMYEGIEIVRRLWRGEKLAFPDAAGKMHEIGTLPRPIQKELPVWITTAGSPETWQSAGSIGANILTHLLGQSIEEIGDKIALYREARTKAGHDPLAGQITLMLHTFVGEDIDQVRDVVRQPMKNYLLSSLGLVKNAVHSWTAFKRRGDGTAQASDLDLKSLSAAEMDDLVEFSFERYFETSGLFGTPQSCLHMVDRLKAVGVSEIACLIDFGVEAEVVLEHLPQLNKLRELSLERTAGAAREDSIGALIDEHGVTHLQCTPSMASMILEDDEARDALKQVTTLMIGGEAFPGSLACELHGATDACIINMYGPTETTIWSSTEEVREDEAVISIGHPIINTQLYILDPNLEPVPVGVPGELFIGGDGVVRGYHNRPELSAERFIKNPFRDDPDARIYRSGDIARWRSGGRVDFLGRRDHQVKIRGHRIELGEIEHRLTEDDLVRKAVVIAREDTPGDVRIVAYVIPAEGASIDAGSLRKSLREKLPEYMVPAHYVSLDAFPLTPNNKIDHKALPAPHEARSTDNQRLASRPANDVEEKIVGIWKEILGIPLAGVEDNFFDLGGHSLLAVKTHRRLVETFDSTITIVDLFRYPTVKALAAFLSATDGKEKLQTSEDRGQARRELMAQRRQMRVEQRGGRV